MENKTFIHYGSSAFDIERFLPIQTYHYNDKKLASKKPWGGLWASPIDTKYGWKEYTEKVGRELRPESFTFKLKNDAKVLVIDKSEDLDSLKPIRGATYGFDFEDAAINYDAIFLSEDGLESQGGFSFSYDNNSMYYQSQKNLFGWDCVSILVLNPDIILLDSEI